jgi:NAD(P)-dependent dehydrogenase (short-subunit alcohol dehydrogenase family)
MGSGLEGRVALVTGGSRGIGLAIARRLLDDGAKVALLARDADGLSRAASELGAGDDALLTVSVDVASRDAVDEAVNRVVAWNDALNIVVNNAGPQLKPTPIAESDDDVVLGALQNKLLGMWRVSRAALAVLPDDGTGRIINVAGQAAKVPIPGGTITGVTNAGVLAFTSYLAGEVCGRNILVNAVSPGLVDTEGWRQRLTMMGQAQDKEPEAVREGMTKGMGIGLGRWAQEREIADVVAFLASDRASYITSQVIGVDGGMDRAVV